MTVKIKLERLSNMTIITQKDNAYLLSRDFNSCNILLCEELIVNIELDAMNIVLSKSDKAHYCINENGEQVGYVDNFLEQNKFSFKYKDKIYVVSRYGSDMFVTDVEDKEVIGYIDEEEDFNLQLYMQEDVEEYLPLIILGYSSCLWYDDGTFTEGDEDTDLDVYAENIKLSILSRYKLRKKFMKDVI